MKKFDFIDLSIESKDSFLRLAIKSICTYSRWSSNWMCFDWSGGLVAASHKNSQLLFRIFRLSTWFSRAKWPTVSI